MSQQALAALSMALRTGGASSEKYRKDTTDKQAHYFEVTQPLAKTAIKTSLSLKKDDEILSVIQENDWDTIAAKFVQTVLNDPGFKARATKQKDGSYLIKPSGAGAKPYDVIRIALHAANKEAIETIEAISKMKAKTASGELVHFDHRRTVSDIHLTNLLTDSTKGKGVMPRELLKVVKDLGLIKEEHYDILHEVSSYYTPGEDKVFKIAIGLQGDLRSGIENTIEGTTVVATRRANLVKAFNNALNRANKIDWSKQRGSDSKVEQVRKSLLKSIKKEFGGKKNTKLTLEKTAPVNRSPAKHTHKTNITEKTVVSKYSVKPVISKASTSAQQVQTTQPSYISMIALFNARLPTIVAGNMTGERLHNQTGTFANSVKVTNITDTAQGFPSVQYTYSRSPYDVFDTALGASPWNTPERDPKKLIEVSIRDIAVDLAMRRFYTRRA